MTDRRCPICGRDAGGYRLGACSPQCDAVMGEDSMPGELIAVLLLVAVVAAFALWVIF